MPKPPSFIVLSNKKEKELPKQFRNDDVRYTELLVKHLLATYTRPGHKVLDPFAGFGTTLTVAEKMGRKAWGVEFDSQRALYVRSLLKNPERLIHGDSRKIIAYGLPKFDFSLTSPPYTARGELENPFTSYSSRGSGYKGYLKDIGRIYKGISRVMKPRSRIVIEIANIKGKGVTTLAWDVAAEIEKIFTFEGEIVVGWKNGYGYGYEHSYCCLVFKHG